MRAQQSTLYLLLANPVTNFISIPAPTGSTKRTDKATSTPSLAIEDDTDGSDAASEDEALRDVEIGDDEDDYRPPAELQGASRLYHRSLTYALADLAFDPLRRRRRRLTAFEAATIAQLAGVA